MCRKALSGERCLGRLSEEKALMWPMIVSALLRALSSILSVMDSGKDFIFLRTRVSKARPRRKSCSARFLPIAFVAEELADQGFGQGRHGFDIRHITRCDFECDDLVELVEHQMQLEAEEPAH